MSEYVYFTKEELACPCCGKLALEPPFLKELVKLRKKVGFAFHVNSCCRCIKHNYEVGGHPKSLHMMENPYHKDANESSIDTCAIDISRHNISSQRLAKLLTAALTSGWSVGIANTFIHLDRGAQVLQRQPRVFTYG